MKTITESQIESWLGKQLKMMGCLYYKFVSPGNDGVPDRIIVLPGGHVIFAELKTDCGQTTPLQDRQQRKLACKGADVQLVIGMEGAERLAGKIKERLEKPYGV